MSNRSIFGTAVIVIIVFFLFIALVWGFATGFRYFTAEITGRVDEEVRVQSADFRIFAYEYFYDLYAEIRSAEARYLIQYELLQEMEPDTREHNYQQRTVAVLKQRIIELKEKYNADVRKEGTRGQFKATDLPSYIEPVAPDPEEN